MSTPGIVAVGVVDSTQQVARELADAGAAHGTAVVAHAQRAGRGRLGRSWESPPGDNLLMSIVLRPRGPITEAPLLSLGAAAGLAVVFGLGVKWPNDLVVRDGRKVGGLLAELDADGTRVRHVILGLGLNVNAAPAHLPATSLAALGAAGEVDVADWLEGARLDVAKVADAARRAILAWSEHPRRLDVWRERSSTLGRRVRIGGREGVAQALRDDGALILDGEPVLTGDVELVARG